MDNVNCNRKVWIKFCCLLNKLHCYKYKLTKPGSGEFLVATMFKQDLNSAIENLQEQELEKNYCKKNYAGTSIENNSILVPA